MLEGAFRHEDSVGHTGTIEAGGLQWMVAGKVSDKLLYEICADTLSGNHVRRFPLILALPP